MIEFSNILLCLMTTDTVSMIANFVTIQIVTVFEDFVYFSMSDEPMKLMLNKAIYKKIFIIRHTTSKKCPAEDRTPALEDSLEEQRPLRVRFEDR